LEIAKHNNMWHLPWLATTASINGACWNLRARFNRTPWH